VHNGVIRSNVNLDTDAYDFASAYAKAKGLALGAAISELLRRAEQIPEPAGSSPLKESPNGYLVIAKTGQKITPEMVKEAAEDDLG
jgi:hypothetical protein